MSKNLNFSSIDSNDWQINYEMANSISKELNCLFNLFYPVAYEIHV